MTGVERITRLKSDPTLRLEAETVVTASLMFDPARKLSTRLTVGVITGVTGVTAVEESDAADEPDTLVAVTVNVYAVPLVKPVTVADVPDTVAV
jgi:hypothetical protein